MIVRVSFILLLTLSGLSSYRQFCDLKSFDSVFNFGHLVHFLRCGEVWTYDPRMNGGTGGFLRDWTFYQIARTFLWGDEILEEDFRFSGFSFEELNCDHYGEDLSESCSLSVQKWNYLKVLFTTEIALTFKYDIEFEPISADNPLNSTQIHYFNVSSSFWPDFLDSHNNRHIPRYLSAVFDPNLEVIFICMRYGKKNLITYKKMGKALHNFNEAPINKKGFNLNWTNPWLFEGNVVGMFYDEHKKKSFIVGEILKESRVYNDQVYPLSLGGTYFNSTVIVEPPEDSLDDKIQNLRTYFGCRYFQHQNKKVKRSLSCQQTDEDTDQVIDIQRDERVEGELIDTDTDFLTKVSNYPIVELKLISLSILILILSFVLLYFTYIKICIENP